MPKHKKEGENRYKRKKRQNLTECRKKSQKSS